MMLHVVVSKEEKKEKRKIVQKRKGANGTNG